MKEPTKAVYVRLPLKEHGQAVEEADKLGISLSAFVRLLIRQWGDGIEFRKRRD